MKKTIQVHKTKKTGRGHKQRNIIIKKGHKTTYIRIDTFLNRNP